MGENLLDHESHGEYFILFILFFYAEGIRGYTSERNRLYFLHTEARTAYFTRIFCRRPTQEARSVLYLRTLTAVAQFVLLYYYYMGPVVTASTLI